MAPAAAGASSPKLSPEVGDDAANTPLDKSQLGPDDTSESREKELKVFKTSNCIGKFGCSYNLIRRMRGRWVELLPCAQI